MVEMYGGRPQLIPLAQTLGPDAFNAIEQHREMYYLLQYEARQMGIQVSVDRLESLLQQRIYVLGADHKRVPYKDIRDPDMQAAVHATVADFLLIQDAAQRAANVLKVSQPMRRQAMATQWQDLTVKLAEFDANTLTKTVPAPTDQQLEQLFEQYANTPAGVYSNEDPLGCGYRYPDRIKLQYLKLDWAELRKAVNASRSDYEWKVEAYKQYQAHPEHYKVPATQPTTAPATQQATTAPAIEPFDKVFGEIRDNLVDDAAKALQQKIRTDIEGRLQKDFDAYTAAAATTAPSGFAGSSSLGVAYTSFDYLHKLADEVQKRYHVRLAIVDLDQYLDAKALDGLAGIGSTHTVSSGDDQPAGPDASTTSFSNYAIADAAPLLPNEGKDNPAALPLYKVSLPLTNPQDDIYYFRLTAAQPAHRPDSLSEVRTQVEQDARLLAAYQQVKQKAQSLLDAARKEGLDAAAKGAGVKVQTVGPITSQPGAPIEGLNLSAVANGQFTQAAFKLLTEAAKSGQKHPLSLIELPAAGKVAVARLETIAPQWTRETLAAYQSITGMELMQRIQQPLIAQWFDYDHLIERVHYVPAPQQS
jgi:hypothetical protein